MKKNTNLKKGKTIQDKANTKFLTNKRILIISLGFIITIVLISLTIWKILDVDFANFGKRVSHATSTRPGLLVFLILFLLIKPIIASVSATVRLIEMGIKVKWYDTLSMCFTLIFLQNITPANLVSDPFSIYWIKSHNVENSRAYCIVATNGLIYQMIQMLVTLPSFCFIAADYQNYKEADATALSFYWLMVVGFALDWFILGFFFLTSFSSHFTYVLSLSFNNVKKLLHLQYHTNEEVKQKYLREQKAKKESIEMIKHWKYTIIISLIFFVGEIWTYGAMYVSLQWIAPDNVGLPFWGIFNCANVAVTACKMFPIPGSQMALDVALKETILISGHVNNQLQPDETGPLVKDSILVFRMFSAYIPTLLGIPAFGFLCYLQFKFIKKTKKAVA